MVVNPWRSAQGMGVRKVEVGDLMREHCLQVGFRHGYDNAVEED
jgi:hypothetical protein